MQEGAKSNFPAWLPYAAPMAVFLGITQLEGQMPQQYVWIYLAKMILVTATLWYFRPTLKDIRIEPKFVLLGLVVGLAVFAEWVLIDKYLPYKHLGERTAYNPYKEIADSGQRALFLGLRFYGLVLLVPVMEEIFWRSFLLRWVTKPDFQQLRIGEFSWQAFWIIAAIFGASHPEWLVAIIAAAAYGLLLRQTKSLFACVVAHAVTNLALGIYVMSTGEWKFW